MNLFTQHPASVGESYFEHMRSAFGFSGRMMFGALACFIHGVLPFCFKKTGSDQISTLHDKMLVNRSRSTVSHAPDGRTGESVKI